MHAGDIRAKSIVKFSFLYAMKADENFGGISPPNLDLGGTRKRRAVSLRP